MREVVLDTETTGLSHEEDRIVEIGCVEIENLIPTGRTFHQYINPQRKSHPAAEKVHGLTEHFLSSKPVFSRIARGFIDFIGDAPLVIHNAQFDLGMINAEFARLGLEPVKNEIRDTLLIARELRPGRRNSLDALCAEYGIDNSRRVKHGALLDSEILAEVYLGLRGGRQFGMALRDGAMRLPSTHLVPEAVSGKVRRQGLRLTAEEFHAHLEMVKSLASGLKKDEKPVWLSYESYETRFNRTDDT